MGEANVKPNGDPFCDSQSNECKSYIIVLIDGKPVFDTKAETNTKYAVYEQEYTSGTSVSKQSIIVFQILGSDLTSSDVLLDSWTLNPSDIDGILRTYFGRKKVRSLSGGYKRNFIDFAAEWL